VFLYRWQPLIGALLALLAGGGAVWAIWLQTKAQIQEARDRRLRLARSFRAVMPDDLKILVTYARRCATVQAFILKFIQADHMTASTLSQAVAAAHSQAITNVEGRNQAGVSRP
jgi:hypothetical protein